MARDDWFRRKTWTDDDRSEFFDRLSRCRGDFHKAQNVRIQAYHLAEAGETRGAVELLETLFADFPQKSQLAQGHMQMAECRIALHQIESAIDEFRCALAAEEQMPNVQTNVWLEFPWLVVLRGMKEYYAEARRFLEWGRRQATFPIQEYKLATIEAFMAADEGDLAAAARFARIALAVARRTHSGFRYHAKLGLVNQEEPAVNERLKKLAAV